MLDSSRKPASCASRMPSSFVAPQTPACVVTGTPSSRATSYAAFSGNAGSPVTSKAIWKPSRSSSSMRRAKAWKSGRRRPLPRGLLDVAVGQHVAAGDSAQRVDRGLGVLDGLQSVRPVHAGGDARVERLGGGEQVARVHVLRAEVPPGLQVVPDEVLGERPVGAVAAHRGLPHVPVGVDHAGHHDAVASRRSRRCPRARPDAGPTAAIAVARRRARRRRAAPCAASSMVSTVPPRRTRPTKSPDFLAIAASSAAVPS